MKLYELIWKEREAKTWGEGIEKQFEPDKKFTDVPDKDEDVLPDGRVKKVCDICGTVFYSQSRNAKFCSPECRQEGKLKYNKKELKGDIRRILCNTTLETTIKKIDQ